MHENQGNSVIYYAHYTEGGVNKTGLTVTIDVYEVIRDGTATLVVDDGACVEVGAGIYRYLLASGTVDAAAEYIGVFHTATATVDAQDIPAMWVIDRAGTEKLDNGVALEATLTAIKGAGWTTETLAALDVLIDAIKAKTDQFVFTTPNKVDASATIDPTGLATSAALAVVDANVDAIKVKTEALDVSSVTVVTAVVGTTITVLRGDTLRAPLLKLGDLTQYVSLDFTVKSNASNSDENAVIRVRKNSSGTDDGLLRLNNAPHATGTDGSITITDPAVGDITIMLKASVTLDLVPGAYVYDIQRIEADGVKTLTSGNLIVAADVTRAVA